MVSRGNEDSQESTVFMQPPKKLTRFKHPSKEEEVLALSNTRKNMTWAYTKYSRTGWPKRNNNGENSDQKTCLLHAFFFTNRLSSAVLTNCVSSVANRALNALLASLSAVFANCSLSFFITIRVLGHYIHGHMHIQCNIDIALDVR